MALPEALGRQDKPFRFADKPSRQARDKGNLHPPGIMIVTDLMHLLRLRLYKGSEAQLRHPRSAIQQEIARPNSALKEAMGRSKTCRPVSPKDVSFLRSSNTGSTLSNPKKHFAAILL